MGFTYTEICRERLPGPLPSSTAMPNSHRALNERRKKVRLGEKEHKETGSLKSSPSALGALAVKIYTMGTLILQGKARLYCCMFGQAHLVIGDHRGRVEQRRTNLRVVLKRLTEERVPCITLSK